MRRIPNIYTIAPETAFLPELVAALLENRLDLGIDYNAAPLKLADLTIYVPTQRAAKALSACFAEKSGKTATFLPRILPLGGLGADEDPFAEEAFSPGLEAISPLDRRLLLMQWILAWGQHLREAVISIGEDGSRQKLNPAETFTAVANPADAFALSKHLAALIDECVIEGIDFERFQALGQGTYDDFWRITLEFLKIAFEQWPKHLAELGQQDAVALRAQMIDAEVARIALGQMRGPVIVAGSTGTNDSTARLIKAISSSKAGAVILPGLDLALDEASFALIDEAGLATHPQAVLARLLKKVGITRETVQPLGSSGLRARFLSQALRPAPTTDVWSAPQAWSAAELKQEFEQFGLIEAENEREEALAIAILLREKLQDPKLSVALVTPERTLAERVSAELGRWGIVPEESSGRSLSRTDAGALAVHLLDAAQEPDAAKLLTLMSHPTADFGFGATLARDYVHLLEAMLFRQVDFALAGSFDVALRLAMDNATSRHAIPLLKNATLEDWEYIGQFAQCVEAALKPLQTLGQATLADWAGAHRAALEAASGELSGRDGVAVLTLLDDLQGAAQTGLLLELADYLHVFMQISAERSIRLYRPGHPRLAILGLLEARLLHADVVILAGMDEKIWPPQSQSDALINRTMRAELGLTPPERRLGQTAHDFMMGFCRGQVYLTRAKKRGGEPTVASRFLQRIEAVAGEAFAPCRSAGNIYLDYARVIDAGFTEPAKRPEPRPSVHLRPKGLSVTAIETLRRDPYSIYAGRILRLPVFGPLKPDFSARDFGTKMHGIFDRFVRAGEQNKLPPQPEQLLRELAEEAFEGEWDAPLFQTFGRAKVERILDEFLAFERERRAELVEIHTEIRGQWDFGLVDGTSFRLSAEADRIEYAKDGTLTLIDFKTGGLPGPNEVVAGFAPQLTLEAHLVAMGAFKGLPKHKAIEALYVKFGGSDKKPTRLAQGAVAAKTQTLKELAEKHFEDLRALLDQMRLEATPYPPRPFPKYAKDQLDYDHLSRFKEWSALGIEDEGEA